MSEPTRLVIIGGVAGGASAAARARRVSEEAEIILIERGEYVSFANCGLPYHIGGVIEERSRLLVQTAEALRATVGLDVRTRTEAAGIDRARKEVAVRNLADGSEYRIAYDKLLLSPGAEPIRPSIPGGDDPRVLTLRSMGDMDRILQVLKERKPSRALVIGGGYIGLEMAEALRTRGLEVTLVELAPQVMGPVDAEMAAPLHQALRRHGVDLRLETSVTAFVDKGEELEAQLSTGESVACGLVLLAIGVRPEVKLAREAGLAIGERGGITVDDHMRTSDPDIFAVGDAVEVPDFVSRLRAVVPLAGPANRQGRIAADNALGRDRVYRMTQGTAICKLFEVVIGMTGMSEKALVRAGLRYEKVYVHPTSHASYYPGAAPLTVKLLFEPEEGRLLGAQVVGTEGVDKRVDVLATALRAGMTVFDLEELELAYAPPFGSAKDPINYAGAVAANVLRGDVQVFHTNTAVSPGEEQVLLDVREAAEVAAGTIPGARHIPLGQLRARLAELPKDKEILVFCQVGRRGYLAARLLAQHGFRVRNLTGGMKTYNAVTGGAPRAAQSRGPSDDSGVSVPPPDRPSPPAAEVKLVDACGLQCPGPIMRLAAELEQAAPGEAVAVLSSDPAFAADIAGWCHSTGNTLQSVAPENGHYRATILKGDPRPQTVEAAPLNKKKTMVVFSGDFDKLMAAFIIANGAAAMGSEVTMFFTFWGINALRRPAPAAVKKNLVERMFGKMMPRGAERLGLSKMHMGGMGLAMIKGIMRKKNVPSLPQLIASAQQAGVKLVVCSMSMDLMGIRREELLDGIETGGVAMYLDRAEAGNVNLFI